MREGVEEGQARMRRGEAHGHEAVESPAMDERIWALLPPELQDNVLARLPVAQLFRMRTVCRRFRALIQSPSFLSSRMTMATLEHWLLMFPRKNHVRWLLMTAYDPRIKHWYNFPVQRLRLRAPPSFALTQVLASAKGLICLTSVQDKQTLVLWNPLTNVSRELPRMSSALRFDMCVGLAVDSATKAFVVAAVGLTEELLYIKEVYDSTVGLWKPMHTSSSMGRRECTLGRGLVHCNGCFHGISYDVTFTELYLISYSLKQGVWKETCKLPIGGNRMYDAWPSLFEVTPGRLFLAGWTFPGGEAYAVHLWELKQVEDGVEWMQVAVVPQVIMAEMWPEWLSKLYFKCEAMGNLVCFIGMNDLRGLVYDLTQDAWHWMPRRGQQYFANFVAFKPRLDMVIA